MSILPQLEQDLLEAADRKHAVGSDAGASRRGVRGRARRLRLPAVAFGCLLATTTIALAATGVILTGAPVRPAGPLNPSAGEGVPTPGASRLLPLRVPDPQGGLPWGMRIVHTTRGEVCVQIGRVENGQLGELGVDGVFHDDGRFHPMSADVLPETSGVGRRVENDDATESVSCQLAGQAVDGEHVGVDRSAGAANADVLARPRGELRDIYYGLLGRDAVSVSYRAGATDLTDAVLPPIGAYLIVRRTAAREQVGTGQEGIGTEGDLPPSLPLAAITYRLDGKLCQRGPSLPPGVTGHLADPCPQPHWPTRHYVPPRDLHRTLHVHLLINHGLLTGAELSFVAPLAVTSAREQYVVSIPNVKCPGTLGTGAELVGGHGGASRNVARGALVSYRISDLALFFGDCGRHPIRRHSATIGVLYMHAEGQGTLLVGAITVTEPAGIHPAPPPTGPPGHRIR